MLTPESLAELRRLYEVAFAVAAPENDWEEWTSKAAEAFPDLLDAAAERDALAADCDALRAERDTLREQVEAMQSTDGLSIMSGWLVYDVGEHTCGGYDYMHEPGCGYEPILDLSNLEGWLGAERDALAAKLDVVREWIDRRGVDVGDRDDDYMRGYRAAQRQALHDAVDLRRTLDADA